MTGRRGFTLLEMMVVLAIIAVVATLAMMLFSRAEILSNESSAISTLRSIHTAEVQYKRRFDAYGDLADLHEAEGEILPADLREGHHGYSFAIVLEEGVSWYATAVPREYDKTGGMSFFVDPEGVVRGTDTGTADVPTLETALTWPALN